MAQLEIPLAQCADEWIGALASATHSAAIADLAGATLLGERAMLSGFHIPDTVSAGGGCRLFTARDDVIALNLSRPSDRELLPALFASDSFDGSDDAAIARAIEDADSQSLVARGRLLGLALAAEHESIDSGPSVEMLTRGIDRPRSDRPLRVVDLSALWAGPLASHLLALAGHDVIKVESRTRPDGMRNGEPQFFSLLNQDKRSVVLDFQAAADIDILRQLLSSADIVIEAARPRALLQLGIDADQIVRSVPGLIWLTITAHGARGEAAQWIGFGDDCAVAAGSSAALREATGHAGFVGDAIADPLTGLFCALTAIQAVHRGHGARLGIAMSRVVAHCIARARATDADRFARQLRAWHRARGSAFPLVRRRSIGSVASFGEHTHACVAELTQSRDH